MIGPEKLSSKISDISEDIESETRVHIQSDLYQFWNNFIVISLCMNIFVFVVSFILIK